MSEHRRGQEQRAPHHRQRADPVGQTPRDWETIRSSRGRSGQHESRAARAESELLRQIESQERSTIVPRRLTRTVANKTQIPRGSTPSPCQGFHRAAKLEYPIERAEGWC
jgi:hypothetical protein